jgi:hypothetical protein
MSLARRSLQVVAFICTLIVGVASMAVIVSQTAWFKEWLRGFIVRQAEDYVNGRLSIGRLDGNLFFGVELEDIDVTMNGQTVVGIKDVGLDYNAFTFIGGDVVLDDIRLNQPVIRLERTPDGWNLARLVKARTPDPDEPKNRRPIEIGEIGVTDGTLLVEEGAVGTSGVDVPARIDRLDASIGVTSNENELTVDIGHVSLRAAEPQLGINALSGVIRRSADEIVFQNVSLRTEESSLRVDGTVRGIESGPPVIDATVSSDKLALDEIARVLPALRGYEMQPAFELTAKGPADRLAVDVNVRDAALGEARGDLTVDAMAPGRRVAGTVAVEHLDVGALVRRTEAGTPGLTSDITGRAQIDLALPSDRLPLSGTYAVNADRVQVAGYEARNVVAKGRIDGRNVRVNATASAYGGRATAEGTVVTAAPLRLDLSGRASDVDLRNLPPALNAPGVASNIDADYRLSGRGQMFSGTVRFHESALAGAAVAPGSTAEFRFGGGAPSYAAKGRVTSLDLQQIGRGFNIQALAADRYASRLNATFDVTGTGGGRYPLLLDATGTLVDSEMFGASFPRMDFTAALRGGDARVQAKGQFAGLDPAVVSGNERLEGAVSGSVDLETTIRDYGEGVTPDSIDAAGRIGLERSAVAGLRVDTAEIEGRYANREGHISRLAIDGPDLTATAQGPIALNETGSSQLKLHLETASLDTIGTIVGQPLKGSAVVDATLTGNAGLLQASGTLQGSNLGHGESEALAVESTFDVRIPGLTPAEATVQANTTATFVEIGGQQINELTADTTYRQSRLEFKAVAQQGARELGAGGSAVFHPDHQEIHLADLSLRAEQIQWSMAAGSEARVRYGQDRIEIDNLRLASGEQRLEADGVIGSETEPLQVRVDNVDVAQIDALLLGDQRLAGRLSAEATVRGDRQAPEVEGQFTLSMGAFRMFTFESLAGSVNYADRGVMLDVRLQQTPSAWFTAKGYAPVSLFRPTPEEMEGEHGAPPEGEAVDLRIASSEIDLGVIQGFTSYVTDVTGVLQANVTVTGSGTDPHFEGAVDIRGGTFAIPALGTSYTGLDTRIDLQTHQIGISEFKILDNRGFPMTVGGTLAVHAREVGEVNVSIQSQNFEVIDNELADLKLDTDLRLTGELRRPAVEGTIEIENGTIHLAELVEQVTSNPYEVDSQDLSAAGADAAARDAAADAAAKGEVEQTEEEPASVFDALALDVVVMVPSNLVLRGDDIRPANAPIEIGDMNVTVGGEMHVGKEPRGTLALTGEVNTVRGSYTFQGRRFDILRDGRIRFAGTDVIDPTLDIRASRVISGVETFVRVQGTMRQPELSFSSNPPLDQADILALIVFNQPINQLGEGEQASLAERAGALAGGYLTSGLARSIGNALELDEFEIQAQTEGGGPALSVGEQVGERLFFRLRQGFGDAQATELILEYQLADFLRLRATGSEIAGGAQRVSFRRVERGGIDLIFFFSY